jgi:hypothetical protein
MGTIISEGEELRRAITWISEQLDNRNGTPVDALINEASVKFNISPKVEEFLTSMYLGSVKF